MALEQALKGSAVLLAATGFIGLLLSRSIPSWLAIVTYEGGQISGRWGALPSL